MSKTMRVFTILLWIAFLTCLAAVFYLSFQDGEAAKALGKDYIYLLAQKYYGVKDIPDEVMTIFTYKVRQIGRIGMFTLLALLGTSVVHATFHSWLWLVRSIIAGSFLLAVAIFTERYKLYLPTRHFSEKEMLYSIAGAMLGFGIVSIMTGVFGLVKWVTSLIIYAIQGIKSHLGHDLDCDDECDEFDEYDE